MKKNQTLLLLFLGAAVAVPTGASAALQDGQDKKKQEKQDAAGAKKARGTIPAMPLLGGSAPQEQPGENAAQKVIREFGEADQLVITRWRSARAEGADEERLQAILALRPDAKVYAARLQAIADENPGKDVACDALLWMFQRERDAEAKNKLLHQILTGHMESPKMAGVVPVFQRGIDAEVAVKALTALRKSPHREVQGLATYILALRLGEDEATGDEAEKLLEQCTKEFADVAYRGRPLGDVAGGALYEQRHLGVGKTAPEIAANDTDGVAFKLSDYRGKVILLDFWGHW